MAGFTERFNGPSLGEICCRLDPKISRGKKEIPFGENQKRLETGFQILPWAIANPFVTAGLCLNPHGFPVKWPWIYPAW